MNLTFNQPVSRTNLRGCFIIVLSVGTLLASGCSGRPERVKLPTYPPAGPASTMRFMTERDAGVRTLQAQCRIKLTDSQGDSHNLDGAIVIRDDTHARLRGSKLGQTLFDLTSTPEGVWLYADSRVEEKIETKQLTAQKIVDGLSLFLRGVKLDAVESARSTPAGLVEVVYEGGRVRATIDPATRTVQAFAILNEKGKVTRQVLMEYTLLDGYVVPISWAGSGLDGTGFRVDLYNIEVNGELNPRAFRPPRRAEQY
jgi:hypothetical protein